MRIYKRKDTNKWAFDIRIEGKRVRRTNFKTKAEATTAAKKAMSEGVPANVTFKKFFEDWAEVYKKPFVTQKRYRGIMNALNQFVAHFGENKKLKDITHSQYQSFINQYAKTRKKGTFDKLHNSLSNALDHAKYEGLISIDPSYNIKTSGHTSDDKKYIDAENLKKIQDWTKTKDTKYALLIYMLSITGARFNEINRMTTDDLIDDVTLHIPGTKTVTSDRIIKISKEDMIHIRGKIDNLALNDKHIFNASNPHINRVLNKIRKEMDIDEHVSSHAFRHTHASELLYAGIDVSYISQRLGHKNVATTLSTYSHLLQEHKNIEEEQTMKLLARKWHEK